MKYHQGSISKLYRSYQNNSELQIIYNKMIYKFYFIDISPLISVYMGPTGVNSLFLSIILSIFIFLSLNLRTL